MSPRIAVHVASAVLVSLAALAWGTFFALFVYPGMLSGASFAVALVWLLVVSGFSAVVILAVWPDRASEGGRVLPPAHPGAATPSAGSPQSPPHSQFTGPAESRRPARFTPPGEVAP